jgi:hypothetical protein
MRSADVISLLTSVGSAALMPTPATGSAGKPDCKQDAPHSEPVNILNLVLAKSILSTPAATYIGAACSEGVTWPGTRSEGMELLVSMIRLPPAKPVLTKDMLLLD